MCHILYCQTGGKTVLDRIRALWPKKVKEPEPEPGELAGSHWRPPEPDNPEEADRIWFVSHPDAEFRDRAIHASETSKYPAGAMLRIFKITPFSRIRVAFWEGHPAPESFNDFPEPQKEYINSLIVEYEAGPKPEPSLFDKPLAKLVFTGKESK